MKEIKVKKETLGNLTMVLIMVLTTIIMFTSMFGENYIICLSMITLFSMAMIFWTEGLCKRIGESDEYDIALWQNVVRWIYYISTIISITSMLLHLFVHFDYIRLSKVLEYICAISGSISFIAAIIIVQNCKGIREIFNK